MVAAPIAAPSLNSFSTLVLVVGQGDNGSEAPPNLVESGEFAMFLWSTKMQSAKHHVIREALILLIYLAASALILNVFMQTRSLEEGNKALGLSEILDGTAERPYVYRRLIPIIANLVDSAIPSHEKLAFVQYHLDKHQLKQRYFNKARYSKDRNTPWTPSLAIRYHVVYALLLLSLISLAYCLRFLASNVLKENKHIPIIAPVLFLLMLPMSFMHGNFFWDFPELFFLAALLFSAVQVRYEWWVFLLPLAVLNKESNILVPILYFPILFAYCGDLRQRFFVLLSVAISASIFVYVRTAFSGNEGSGAIWQLPENLEFWLNPRNYFLWHDFYAPLVPFPRGGNILFAAFILTFLAIGGREQPVWLKQTFWIAVAISLPLMLLFCWRDEMRNLSFTFVPAYLLACFSLRLVFPSRLMSQKELAGGSERI